MPELTGIGGGLRSPSACSATLSISVICYTEVYFRNGRRMKPLTNRVESAEFVQFARMWGPFGGPPDEEIFVRFGMSRARFERCLAQILRERSLPRNARTW